MSFKDKMKKLKLTFIDKLPEYLAKIEASCDQLTKASQSNFEDILQDVFLQFHSVKGTSATFGLGAINAVAKDGEAKASELIKVYRDEGLSDRFNELFLSLKECTSELRTLIEKTEIDAVSDNNTPSLGVFEAVENQATAPADRKLIYICDDAPDSVEHLRLQLKYLGYTVQPFLETETLLQATLDKRPAAIVMDITFPKGQLSGPEVVKDIGEKLGTLPPVIFISARSDYQARFEAVKAKGDAYYVKPLNVFDLVHTLDQLTSHKSGESNRVLIVDDEPAISAYHSTILNEASMTTRELALPENILEVLEDFRPDLVLMDVHMPKYSGHDVAKIIRQIPDYISLPIIYLSSETDVSKQANALRAGAEGFLTKPIQPETLINEVNVRVERMRDLRALMVRDSLTGLFNHTFIRRFLNTTFANAFRAKQSCSVVMIDIDHFKAVNDTYGHPMGDQVLIAISRLLRQSVREGDAVGRYGGEEFVMVLNNVTKEIAQNIIDKIRISFSKLRFEHHDQFFHCTFSAGIGDSNGFDNTVDLMEQTDQALYKCKQNGRNQISLTGKGNRTDG